MPGGARLAANSSPLRAGAPGRFTASLPCFQRGTWRSGRMCYTTTYASPTTPISWLWFELSSAPTAACARARAAPCIYSTFALRLFRSHFLSRLAPAYRAFTTYCPTPTTLPRTYLPRAGSRTHTRTTACRARHRRQTWCFSPRVCYRAEPGALHYLCLRTYLGAMSLLELSAHAHTHLPGYYELGRTRQGCAGMEQ